MLKLRIVITKFWQSIVDDTSCQVSGNEMQGLVVIFNLSCGVTTTTVQIIGISVGAAGFLIVLIVGIIICKKSQLRLNKEELTFITTTVREK